MRYARFKQKFFCLSLPGFRMRLKLGVSPLFSKRGT